MVRRATRDERTGEGGGGVRTRGGRGEARHNTPSSSPPRPRTTHHKMLCNLVEWTCVVGLPTCWCIKIIGLPSVVSLKHLLGVGGAANGDAVATNTSPYNEEACSSLQWLLLVLVLSAMLSFVAITCCGDDGIGNTCKQKSSNATTIRTLSHDSNSNTNGLSKHDSYNSKSRGIGVAIGTHLIPLLYISIHIFLCNNTNSQLQPGTTTCSIEELGTTNGVELRHANFATLGGLAFVASYLRVRSTVSCDHRKCNSNRLRSETNEPQTNNRETQQRVSEHTMQICWGIYLVFLLFHVILFHQSNHCLPTLLLGLIHVILIVGYTCRQSPSSARGAWQDAFTPGEWMVVSSLISSLLGEFILQSLGIVVAECPSHIIVAHAGIVGCIIGVGLSLLARKRIYNDTQSATLAVLSTAIVITSTLFCLESTLSSSKVWMPRSVQWLVSFLSATIDLSVEYDASRVAILVYWVLVLVTFLPMATLLVSWIAADEKCINDNNDTTQQSRTDEGGHFYHNRKQRVVIARKYFHLMAILLFTPITWLDRDMMSLSYAISVSLLLVLEMIRCQLSTEASGVDQQSALLNQFYMVFLDEKDSSAADGGLAVTHIALVVGCALPLWVHQMLEMQGTDELSFTTKWLFSLLPHLGVLVLGVGDSAGAVGGMRLGRHRWPGASPRTFEGSLCMYLSMMFAVLCTCMVIVGSNMEDTLNCLLECSSLLCLLTLIEASTTQIDNLCLPIAGSTILILAAT